MAAARASFAGTFEDAEGRQVIIRPRSGASYVTADANGTTIEAE
ncbi:hypothetical protein [Bradyrhizobium uaiense]|nr:hypothetical protein [Bradyrhizobium uaiense]